MNIIKDVQLFEKYVRENYDMSNELINLKYVHTLNVVKVAIEIAMKMHLSKEDFDLAFYTALFHDLGRFKEVVRQKKFNNLKFDHGSYSNKILFNDGFIKCFDIKEDDYLIIRKAIYYHNKKSIPDNLSKRELLIANLLRDADRTDILRVCVDNQKMQPKFDSLPSTKVLRDFMNGDGVDIKDIHNNSDRVLLRLGFVHLFSSKESLDVLFETGNLDNYIKKVIVSKEYEALFNCILDEVNKHFDNMEKDKEKKYVR